MGLIAKRKSGELICASSTGTVTSSGEISAKSSNKKVKFRASTKRRKASHSSSEDEKDSVDFGEEASFVTTATTETASSAASGSTVASLSEDCDSDGPPCRQIEVDSCSGDEMDIDDSILFEVFMDTTRFVHIPYYCFTYVGCSTWR